MFGNFYNLVQVSHQHTLWKTYSGTYCEKHKVFLVVLPNAVIDPGTVVVHFPYTAFANTVGEPGSMKENHQNSNTNKQSYANPPNNRTNTQKRAFSFIFEKFLFHKRVKLKISENNLEAFTAGVTMIWESNEKFTPIFGLPAVVRSVRFDAAALGAFVDHLPWFQLKAFYVFLGSISLWHCPLVRNNPILDKNIQVYQCSVL